MTSTLILYHQNFTTCWRDNRTQLSIVLSVISYHQWYYARCSTMILRFPIIIIILITRAMIVKNKKVNSHYIRHSRIMEVKKLKNLDQQSWANGWRIRESPYYTDLRWWCFTNIIFLKYSLTTNVGTIYYKQSEQYFI